MDIRKSDKQMQAEIREELAREPSVDSNAIGITADHGLVFLSGHALGVSQRRAAVEAAQRVGGVRAVIDELKIRPGRWGAHDADVASVATDSLSHLVGLPDGRVKVIVRNGQVRLNGSVARVDERDLIGAAVRHAIGREVGMDNAISVDPGAIALFDPATPWPLPLAEEPADGPRAHVDETPPEASSMIIVNETFTDEGIPIRSVHHRDFPEIRGEGETTSQGLARLSGHLDRAREHASEPWQLEAIDRARLDVRAYDPSLATETACAEAAEGRPNFLRVDHPPMNVVAH